MRLRIATALLAGIALWVGPALPVAGAAASFTVNSAGDQSDIDLSDADCETAGGTCSLRAAIEQSNASPGADTISFGIGVGAASISVATDLPVLSGPTSLDGTSQPGYSGQPLVTVQGPGTGVGFDVGGGNSLLKGLRVQGFASAVVLASPGNGVIGSRIASTTAQPAGETGVGIEILADDNEIGGEVGVSTSGPCTGDCNLISGNRVGILISGPATGPPIGAGVVIQGNRIGTDPTGVASVPNGEEGILATGRVEGILVGGTDPAEGNLVSGNGGDGIRSTQRSPGLWLGTIEGNRIGTDLSGFSPLPNGGWGVDVGSAVVGSATVTSSSTSCTGACNLVSGNLAGGVRAGVEGSGSINGNFIGVSRTGDIAIPNGGYGVSTSGADVGFNVVSGNSGGGIHAMGGVGIIGNKIGVDPTASIAIANGDGGDLAAGLMIGSVDEPSLSVTVGATSDVSQRNVISGNQGPGVMIVGDPGTDNTRLTQMYANLIGTNGSGTQAIPNVGPGIDVRPGAVDLRMTTMPGVAAASVVSGNTGPGLNFAGAGGHRIDRTLIGTGVDGVSDIGNLGPGVVIHGANVDVRSGTIAHNGGDGIVVTQGEDSNIGDVTVFDNAGIGIDLGDDGVTNDDLGDTDIGPNELLNAPTITSAGTWGATSVVQVHLDGPEVGGAYELRLYASDQCDPSGHGEGERLIWSEPAFSSGDFPVVLADTLGDGTIVTATVSRWSEGSTSEFSSCASVSDHPADGDPPLATVSAPVDGGLYTAGLRLTLDFACTDPGGIGLEACRGEFTNPGQTYADGEDEFVGGGGMHEFTVRARDLAGNTAVSSVSYEVVQGSIVRSLPGPGIVDTDPSGIGANDAVPIQTAVTSPLGGTISIQSGARTLEEPRGWKLVGPEVTIEAPLTGSDDPLAIRFLLDEPLWSGEAAEIRPMLDGHPVQLCTGSIGTSFPDPCALETARLPSGDVLVSVLATGLGRWTFGWQVPAYGFEGFFGPVDDRPVVNVLSQFTAAPVRFSLGRDAGMDIFVAGYPDVSRISCPSARQDKVEHGVSWGDPGLTFDPITDRYTYVFHPRHRWRHSCRLVDFRFADGSHKSLIFRVK